MVARLQEFFTRPPQIAPQVVSYEQKSALQEHVLVHLLLLPVNWLGEHDPDILGGEEGAEVENPIQPHSPSLEAPVHLIDQPIPVRVEGVPGVLFKIVIIFL